MRYGIGRVMREQIVSMKLWLYYQIAVDSAGSATGIL